jgi:hypothetical protein
VDTRAFSLVASIEMVFVLVLGVMVARDDEGLLFLVLT